MKIHCDYCGKEIDRRPSKVKEKNYCDKNCRHLDKFVLVECSHCGKQFERLKNYVTRHNFCCQACAKHFTSARMTEYNIRTNPNAMNYTRRNNIRAKHLGRGVGKSYEKTFGRHTHRIVAEQIIGRPLKLGEVVHHINGDKRDNRIENLMVFPSQRLHAEWHKKHDHEIQTLRLSKNRN